MLHTLLAEAYLLAEENGLTDVDAVLESGQQPKVPNRVISLANAVSSFKPSM